MSGSNERNNENYKHRNEKGMKRPILPMSVNNLRTKINTTKKKKKGRDLKKMYFLLKQGSEFTVLVHKKNFSFY